jgi:hypothetical protein
MAFLLGKIGKNELDLFNNPVAYRIGLAKCTAF